MLAVWNVLVTIFYAVLTLLSLPTFWCVMFVLLFEVSFDVVGWNCALIEVLLLLGGRAVFALRLRVPSCVSVN